MPEKKTMQRARAKARRGNAKSTQAGEFVAETMRHKKTGKKAKAKKQAIAIGLSKARRAGVSVGKKKKTGGGQRMAARRSKKTGGRIASRGRRKLSRKIGRAHRRVGSKRR